MSDAIKHECGIALIRLLKPLEYYKEKYGSAFYGVHKMYLLMEKQHNRGQDGAGFASIKLDTEPGSRFMSRVRSADQHPIQDVFSKINERINTELENHPEYKDDVAAQKRNLPYIGEVLLGHVRYGTFGKNSIESVHPFLRQNNWMHRNLIVAGNFNLTNVSELFDNLVRLGQHPKEKSDTVTVMEKIGHFLDSAVAKLYKQFRDQGYTKAEASPLIAAELNIPKILRKASKIWDGGYVIGGMFGHGDSFVMRDPSGIRPAYYYKDDEIVVVASERPAIQTVFDVSLDAVEELHPGKAIIIKKDGTISFKKIQEPTEKRACSFERIYFSRGSDSDIYKERKKLGELLLPKITESIGGDFQNTVFSYIPNTAETSFYGLIGEVQSQMSREAETLILKEGNKLTQERLRAILDSRPRIEKIAIKDAKLRTFISEDSGRNDLVAHVYDVTYGVIKPTDNLVIVDDSIVRGTTLQKSILRMLDRLNPKKIIVVSSAPQIRYPDCYGIDMARLEAFIAFRATLALLEETGQMNLIEEVYKKCKKQLLLSDDRMTNAVQDFYAPFTAEEISIKIAQIIKTSSIQAEVDVIYQTVDNLHIACPDNLGDWYFTGDYPTPGGNRVVNQAFVNYYEGKNERAY